MLRKRLWLPVVLSLFPMLTAFSEEVNKDRPQRGEWDFRLKKVWETASAGDEVLGLPQGIIISDEGTLYLSDAANRKDYMFDPDGGFVGSFAARGEGPGEVQRHGRFFFGGDKLIIADIGRLHYFTKEGKFLTTVRRDCEPHAILDENRFIDAPLSAVFLPEGKGSISLCDLRSGQDTVISGFSAFEGGVARNDETVVDVIVPLFSPLMTIGYSGDRLYWGLSDRYVIRATDLAGREITAFSVDRKKKKISGGDKREYFNKGNLPSEMLKQLVDSVPDEVTCFYRIEVHNGLVFVFIPDIDLENRTLRTKQIDIFSPGGKYLYRAPLMFGKNRVHLTSPLQNLVIKGDFLYAVLQDEEDRVLVAKYRVTLPAL